MACFKPLQIVIPLLASPYSLPWRLYLTILGINLQLLRSTSQFLPNLVINSLDLLCVSCLLALCLVHAFGPIAQLEQLTGCKSFPCTT